MAQISLKLPKPHPGQAQVRREAKRFNVVNCGRRWGKTLFGTVLLVEAALEGYPVGWFSPKYKMLEEAWREVKNRVKDVTKRVNSQQHRIELITGGVIEMWSLDQPDTSRGRKYKRVLVDEAAMVRSLQEAWQSVIRPTLADFEGDGWFLSTPKGFNYYYSLYAQGMDPSNDDYMSWKFPTTTNPYISKKEIESAKRELPERVFAQEFLAEFIGDGTGVFRNVTASATAIPMPRFEDHRYVIGCDWGKLNDFTVFVVLDTTTMSMVYMERSNKIDYMIQFDALKRLAAQYQPDVILAERNSVGEFAFEMARRDGLRMSPFVSTNSSKANLITGLELSFDRHAIKIFDDPLVIGELVAYDMERLPSGNIRYAAPEGQHDDIVMALALAHFAAVGRGNIEAVTPEMAELLRDYFGGYAF